MKELEKVIDINAHIENLKCEVNTENGNVVAKISFDNMGYGDITAIKFNACGYNTFEDVVSINGKNNFFLIIQDINIPKNESAVDLKAKLPEGDIRKLDIVESQICFADGSIVTYSGDQSLSFPIEEYDNQEEIAALHKLYSDKATYKIKDFEQGWICTCGRFNTNNSTKCTLCGKSKSETEKICSEEGIKNLVEKYRISEEEDAKARAEAEKKANAEKKKRNIMIGIAVAVCIALAFPIGNAMIMGGQTTYSSEEEMKEAVQGTYTYYEDHDAKKQIEIDGDQFRYIYKYTESNYWMDLEFFPSKGTMETFETIVVTSNGDLKVDGELFEKGGYISTGSDSSSSSYSYSSGYTDLDVNRLEWDSNSSYTICTGKVTNNGEKTYTFVTVKGSFKDSSGSVLDTDSTYAVGSEGLAPGESTSFRLSVDKDSKITDCSVSILDFD